MHHGLSHVKSTFHRGSCIRHASVHSEQTTRTLRGLKLQSSHVRQTLSVGLYVHLRPIFKPRRAQIVISRTFMSSMFWYQLYYCSFLSLHFNVSRTDKTRRATIPSGIFNGHHLVRVSRAWTPSLSRTLSLNFNLHITTHFCLRLTTFSLTRVALSFPTTSYF